MKTWMGALVCVMSSTACVSQYSQGPRYERVAPPEGQSVVHVYRPQKSWGAASSIDVFLYGRHVSLCSGSYATFIVPPGSHTVDVAILAFGTVILMNGLGFTGIASSATEANARAPVPIEVTPGESAFVKVEFTSAGEPPKSTWVKGKDGPDEISGLHLIPGGRGRWPVAFPPTKQD